jgi:hypothetical protein
MVRGRRWCGGRQWSLAPASSFENSRAVKINGAREVVCGALRAFLYGLWMETIPAVWDRADSGMCDLRIWVPSTGNDTMVNTEKSAGTAVPL